MRHKVQAKFPGMIPSAEYCRKYSVNNSTVHSWVKAGKLPGLRDGNWLHVEDRPPAEPKRYDTVRKDEKFCGCCKLWKPLTDYSPSRRKAEGICRECNTYRVRVRRCGEHHPDNIVYKQEMIAQRERAEMKAAGKLRLREQAIAKEAERIRSLGL